MIRDGKAKLKAYRQKRFEEYGDVKLLKAYEYPEREEDRKYREAKAAIQQEKNDRELALETALNNLTGKAILGVLSAGDFLKELERMSSQKW